MKILVTGSRGTLGKPLVKALKEKGHTVYEVDLFHSQEQLYFRADVGNYRQLRRVFDIIKTVDGVKIDYVYHLAAEFGRHNGEQFYEQLWSTNAIGTKNILEIQKEDCFDKLIFMSSSEVYGNIDKENLYEDLTDETAILHHNDYAMSKWVNEQQILNHIYLTKLPVMRIRLFNAYGPGEHYHPFRSVICLFCYRALKGIPYTVFSGYKRVFMYIDDLIPTLVKCSSNFSSGVFNVGGVEFREIKEASDLILTTLGLTDKNVIYLKQDAHNTVNKNPDITKAQMVLGHNPTITLEQGIPETLNWMKVTYGFSCC